MKKILSFNLTKESLKKDKEKYTFQITFNEITGLPKLANKPLFIAYKQTKTKKIETPRVDTENGTAKWNYDLVFKSSLKGKDLKGNQKKKNLSFVIYEQVTKGTKNMIKANSKIGVLNLNLADFVSKECKGNSFDKEYDILCWKKYTFLFKVKIASYRGDPPKDVVANSQSSLDLSSSTTGLTPLNTGEDATEFGDLDADEEDDDCVDEEEDEEISMNDDRIQFPNLNLNNTDVIICSVSSSPRKLPPKKATGMLGWEALISKTSATTTKSNPTLSTIRAPEKRASFKKKRNTVKLTSVDLNLEEKMYKLEQLKQEQNERDIIESTITLNEPEFARGIPISAVTLFRSLVSWDCFQLNHQNFPNKIIKTLKITLKKNKSKMEPLSYWMGNLCTLLNLIRLEYPLTFDEEKSKTQSQNKKTSSVTQFARIIEDDENFGEFKLKLTKNEEDENVSIMDETPLMQFKSELEKLLGITYGFLLSLIYKELDELLIPCTFLEELSTGKNGSPFVILKIFNDFLKTFQSNGVFNEISEQFFGQVFYFINGHLLNILLTHRKYCSMKASVNLKMMTSDLSNWADENNFLKCKKNFNNLRDISNILMVDKSELVDESVRKQVCPSLQICQILNILCFYHADEFDPVGEVSLFIIQKLNDLCVGEKEIIYDEFIIDKPYLTTLIEMPSWKYLDLPKGLNKGFSFLKEKDQE
eukprot:gene8480-302_t